MIIGKFIINYLMFRIGKIEKLSLTQTKKTLINGDLRALLNP